jgi:hypothetical protein
MIPEQIKQFLWSYDTERMDVKDDAKIIIFNILNYGDMNSKNGFLKVILERRL